MARVSLHFEDDEKTGLIDFRADYKGGYRPNSQAHNLANQVIHFLEREAVEKVIPAGEAYVPERDAMVGPSETPDV